MTLNQRYQEILELFQKMMPVAESELNFDNAYQLLVAVILSAQCTDKRVNMVTPAIFARYPSPSSLATAGVEDLLPLVKSVSYPNSKALHLSQLGKELVLRFGGEIPSGIDDLMSLPGVGRKTANVVASIMFGEPVIAVDTHVFRVSHRLGLSSGKTPEAVEKDLERHVPAQLRPKCHHWLILFGRYTCTAQRPKCGECPLKLYCKR